MWAVPVNIAPSPESIIFPQDIGEFIVLTQSNTIWSHQNQESKEEPLHADNPLPKITPEYPNSKYHSLVRPPRI